MILDSKNYLKKPILKDHPISIFDFLTSEKTKSQKQKKTSIFQCIGGGTPDRSFFLNVHAGRALTDGHIVFSCPADDGWTDDVRLRVFSMN